MQWSLIWPAVRDVARGTAAGVTLYGTGFELHRGLNDALLPCLTGEQSGERVPLAAGGGSLMVHENRYVRTGLSTAGIADGCSFRRTGLADEQRLCSGERTRHEGGPGGLLLLRVMLRERTWGDDVSTVRGDGLLGTDS